MRYFGAAYYPEIFPRDEWEADVTRMAEAGMNVVRLAEAAWLYLEPEEGRFSFQWLDDVLALCQRHNISVVLGTPTFIPPAWLVAAHPDILPDTAHGHRMGLGGRHHYCLHAESFVEATRRIVQAMGQHFGEHPNVIGWQLHNEFGLSTCYCERCLAAWRRWLRERYGSIQQLNEAWGNHCWGHDYIDFDQIPLPSEATEPPEGRHPLSIILAHCRFRSDAIRRYQGIQIAELRGRIGDRWLTHNAMGLDLCTDHYDLFADLDVAAWDNYPPLHGGWTRAAISHGLYRRLKQRRHWVMEQMCGSFGGGETAWAAQPAPGEVARWTLHSYGHGAEAVLFWLWRSMPAGNWPYWEGLLTPGGHPTERYEEVRRLGHDLKALRSGGEQGTTQETEAGTSQIALVLSYDNLWALERDKGAPTFAMGVVLDDMYAAVAATGLRLDVVSPLDDFSPYRVIIVPALSLVRPEIAQHLATYVRDGGIAVLPPRTGRYTWEGTLQLALAPGPAAALCGVQIRDCDVLLDGGTVTVSGETHAATGRWWCDLIEPTTAETVATYANGRYAGRPAITRNRHGAGYVLYLGTYLDAGGVADVLRLALEHAGIATPWRVPPGCEVTRAGGMTFLFNHTDEDKIVWVPDGWVDVRDATKRTGLVTMAPNQVLLLRRADRAGL